MKLKTILAGLLGSLAFAGAAQAHLTAYGWKDNGNGSVTLWAQHWHGYVTEPASDNGGIRIGAVGTDVNTWQVFQWTNVVNDIGGGLNGLNSMVSSGVLTGYQIEPENFGNVASHNDWFTTNPLVIGNGTWGFYTGSNCCTDTMSAPSQFTLTGIVSVDDGTGPGQVPEPATMSLLGLGVAGMLTAYRRRRQSSAV